MDVARFEPMSKATVLELGTEAESLARFMEPDASNVRVVCQAAYA
jgi:hypothetical protein